MQQQEHPETKPSDLLQLKALFRKTATLQVRQRKTMVCQTVMPVLLLVLVWLIQNQIASDGSDEDQYSNVAVAARQCDKCMNGYYERTIWDDETKQQVDDTDSTYFAGKGGSRPLQVDSCCLDPSCFCDMEDMNCGTCKVSVR